MSTRKMSFEMACARYVHRYTMDHVPEWAKQIREDGTYYAPQYRSDREWYDLSLFPGDPDYYAFAAPPNCCVSRLPTWPLGKALLVPYRR